MLRFNIKTYMGISFNYLRNIQYVVINSTAYYYVPDVYGNNTLIFDENWNYLSSKPFPSPLYIQYVDGWFYLTNSTHLVKTDINLIPVNAYLGDITRGIFYNITDQTVYLLNYFGRIDILDKNLTLLSNFSLGSYILATATLYNNSLFITTYYGNGEILVVQDKKITNIYYTSCVGSFLNTVLFDNYNFMAFTCSNAFKLKLYLSNGTFTGNDISFPNNPTFVYVDMKGRMIVANYSEINIFY
jgi:hypothetical protein